MKHRPAEYFAAVPSAAAPPAITVDQVLACSASCFVPVIKARIAAGDPPDTMAAIGVSDGVAVAVVTWSGKRPIYLHVDLEALDR